LNIDENHFEQEVDGLIEWCEDLDFDKYMENWNMIATSAKHDMVPNDESLHVVGLGELTIGNPNQTG
jgi:hypothetical protein